MSQKKSPSPKASSKNSAKKPEKKAVRKNTTKKKAVMKAPLAVKFVKKYAKASDTIVFITYDDKKLPSHSSKTLDKAAVSTIEKAIKDTACFKGENGQTISVILPEGSIYTRAVIVSVGDKSTLNEVKTEEAGGKLFLALKCAGAHKVDIDAGTFKYAHHLAIGLKMRGYSFDKYKEKKTCDAPCLAQINVISDSKKDFETLDSVISGVFTARDLVNEPPNTLSPDFYAKFIKKELEPLGVKVEILDEKKMEKLGMGAILAVGMGSSRKPRMVIMSWKGGKKKSTAPLALVGKGVTFDTGGISLKPGAGMDEMKMDMGGSAAVVGTMKAIATRKAKANVVGIVGLAENMPSSTAYRPGDIITSYAGKTIEVLNTDAEGRLVLSDCLAYVQEKYKPQAIIDLATLTGAMMVALGHEYCGTFVTDDTLWTNMEKAGTATGEKLWRMPLDEVWKKDMESEVADIKNMGGSRYAGACTAAGFLQHFIVGDTPWAHMDIAGTAWRKSDQPTVPKFGSGFGVRTLDRLIADVYEGK